MYDECPEQLFVACLNSSLCLLCTSNYSCWFHTMRTLSLLLCLSFPLPSVISGCLRDHQLKVAHVLPLAVSPGLISQASAQDLTGCRPVVVWAVAPSGASILFQAHWLAESSCLQLQKPRGTLLEGRQVHLSLESLCWGRLLSQGLDPSGGRKWEDHLGGSMFYYEQSSPALAGQWHLMDSLKQRCQGETLMLH